MIVPEEKPLLAEANEPPDQWLQTAPVMHLLRRQGEILAELRRREIVRTANGPLGDIAELLCARAFGWTLAENGASGHDAEDGEGLRYQVKARRLASPSASRQLSFIRKLPEKPFDQLVGVLFDSHFNVFRAALVPYAVVLARSSYVAHTNGWRFHLKNCVWAEPGVEDVTAQLRACAETL
jgi:hypothetical protein